MTRGINRLKALVGAALNAVTGPARDSRPSEVKKVLVLHELLLGDTLMLAPLLAGLRERYPQAEIFVTANAAYAGLFNRNPYGAHVLPYTEREAKSLSMLDPARNCDIAILPGDNRLALAARALGAKWVVGFAGGRPAWRDRAVNELVSLPLEPMTVADMFVLLAGLSETDASRMRYRTADWPAPDFASFDFPEIPYAVLHVGAGSSLRLWESEKWACIASHIAANGIGVVWSCGTSEAALVRDIDPGSKFPSFAGKLDLPQLWHLMARARFAVTLDTGIAHMAKLTCTPTTALYGPGSAVLFGKGRFWEGNDFVEVTRANYPCRDQHHVFKRNIEWAQRCNRTPAECPHARCMADISVEQVIAALQVE